MSAPNKIQETNNGAEFLLTSVPILDLIGSKRVFEVPKKERIYSQGEPADAVYFIESGKVKITVVSFVGKEATLSVVGPGGFIGEGCLTGQRARLSTATALEASTLARVEKLAMAHLLHQQPRLTEAFIAHLLARNIDLEKDLCTQLFDHSEKRLARVLLKLSRFGERGEESDVIIPKFSHETLAEMVGTTRSRVTFFMNKFKSQGLIDYSGGIVVRAAQLTDAVLND
jgi:CRP/FNR family cyclic AMP-dependent transcriptional regulator